MPNSEEYLNKYLADHQSDYKGKYRFKCGYRSGEHEYKVIFYILDISFREIDIYVDIKYDGEIHADFSESLNERERQYIINEIIKIILQHNKHHTLLHYTLYEKFVNDKNIQMTNLAPMDFIDIYSYMKYHQGKNQKTVDHFYEIFRPALLRLRNTESYDTYLDAVNLLLEDIKYEYEWGQGNSTYLDTEYQFHLFYLREMMSIFINNFDSFYEAAPQKCHDINKLLCENVRFALMILFDATKIESKHTACLDEALADLGKDFKLYDAEKKNQDSNLVYSFLYFLYKEDRIDYRMTVENIIRYLMNYILCYVNHDLDIALGNAFIEQEGFEIIIDIFQEDYNTMIFTAFPISAFPDYLRDTVRDELTNAIRFFAARMDDEHYRVSSLEQVLNINRLLLDNFKEWYT